MSAPNALIRAEMEVNPRLQNAIAAHHIIQVVSPVVISICVASSLASPWPLLFLRWALVPIYVFIIYWIASKCSYKDLRLILVHFNATLCVMWSAVHFYFFITFILFIDEIVTLVLVIFTGFLCLCSAIFFTIGTWKSARKVVLTARLVKSEGYEVLDNLPLILE
ncbi:hypothetical protein ACJMK2_029639 [Sinanodonta woodiana]|uniref:Uncharacterized protein n=1 Tax=Sinanodonta woodiana TaxID=1069815 RepID=A0ABD3XCA6_SINWO